MGADLNQFSHDDIDPSSIEHPTFGHDDIVTSSILAPEGAATEPEWKSHVRPWLNALPTAGMVGGGAVGSLVGPLTAVGGAALGDAAGEALKNLGEQYVLGDRKTRSEIYGNPAKGLVEGATAEMGGRSLEGLAETKPAHWAMQKLGSGAKYLASNLSGVPAKEIETYAKLPEAVKELARSSDNDHQEMADQIRKSINDTIKGHREKLNGQISTALGSASKEKTIDVSPIVEHLESQKAALDPHLHREAINDIDNLLERIKGSSAQSAAPALAFDAPNEMLAVTRGNTTELMNDLPNKLTQKWKDPAAQAKRGISIDTVPVIAESAARQSSPGVPTFPTAGAAAGDQIIELPTGNGGTKYLANAQKLHDINQFLQSQASSAYGQSAVGFQVGDKAARVAKGAASVGRKILGEVSPDVAAANAGLSRLHGIEDVMNKNMLEEGKTPTSLFAAGSGENSANAKALKQLSEETGSNISGEAQKLAAARTFGNPSLTPVDKTGKSAARMLLAGAGGGLAGYKEGGPEGAAVGFLAAEGLTSPAAIKVAIDSGLASKAIAKAAAGKVPSAIGKMFVPSIDREQGEQAAPPSSAEPNLTPAKSAPSKGPDKWANDGLQKLLEHAPASDRELIGSNLDGLLNSKTGKKLLVSASDLKPGSKAMADVLGKVKAELAKTGGEQ